jgi:hypothetical protein
MPPELLHFLQEVMLRHGTRQSAAGLIPPDEWRPVRETMPTKSTEERRQGTASMKGKRVTTCGIGQRQADGRLHDSDLRRLTATEFAWSFTSMDGNSASGCPSLQSLAQLICVDPELVHEIWPLAKPLLRRAIARTGLSAFCDLEREILCGNALLWLAVEGEGSKIAILAAASTKLQLTETEKVCLITACSGQDMLRWLGLIGQIEEFARNEGCNCVRIYGRKGWLRALVGYEQTHVILDKELN